jgi:HdeA/HdeB family
LGGAAAHTGLAALTVLGIAEVAETSQNDASCLPTDREIVPIDRDFISIWRTLMRKLVFGLILATSLVPSAGHAQVTLNMTQVTCANYLAMSPSQARVFSAWMSGWFNQRFGYVTVGFDDFARNVASVSQWCSGNPQATIMAALERSTLQPAPAGQIKVDMSLITCKQYSTSDAQRQEMIAYWMSGYFRASRNEPIFDFQRALPTIRGPSATTARKMGARRL